MHIAVIIAVFLLLSTSRALSDCPDGWLHHGSSCYHISHDKEPMITASASCQHMGGEFVEMESAAENAFLFAQIKPLKIEAWLGLNDIQEETIWHWYGSNRPLTSTGFKNWHSGEPNNLQDDENCALMSPANGQWYDGHCHVPLHYICEKSYGSGEIVG